ncbi:hypothetical protein [Streptomyces silvensis]|uniref:Uncharacterized protein n=1 Tax=Streptomyces silvensis TaxID=1765722 RepID=A0A0W7WTD0_9ACTN|nr:hypothetical protein [Streptomyces silvensis]KUF13767.1 hypothetical protein AT728_00320 [Streptomyces silvensis]
MPVVTLARWVMRCLTAWRSTDTSGNAPPVGGTAADGPDANDSPGDPQEEDATDSPATTPSQLHDLFREGMKDPVFARELNRLLDSEHRRSLHTQEQQTLSFLAKAGCVSVCLVAVIAALAPAAIIAKGVVAQYDIAPWHFVTALAGICGLLTAGVGWLVRTLRRGRPRAGPTDDPGPPANGAAADGPAPRAGTG